MTDEQLTALLRLKRYEKPPEGYFDRLLQGVHRRQRAELLQRPLWKIAIERIQVFFGEHSMGNVSYAGAMAAVLVVGVGAISVLTPGEEKKGPQLAKAPVAPESQLAGKVVSQPEPPITPFTLEGQQRASLGLQPFPSAPAHFSSQMYPPRHVSDVRPASYEPSSSISF